MLVDKFNGGDNLWRVAFTFITIQLWVSETRATSRNYVTDWFPGALITKDVLLLAWNINTMEKIVAVEDEDDEGEDTARRS